MKWTVVWNFALLMGFPLFLCIAFPMIFYMSPLARRHAIFSHYINRNWYKNLSAPGEFGLNGTSNFYINSSDGVMLGTWYIPASKAICNSGTLNFDKGISDNKPVFLYLHGNAETRGEKHRVQLYKVLTEKVDVHVVAFDYRGFGDSTNINPNQDGLISDALHIYNWLREYVDTSRIYVWGHSLGTGVGTALLHKLLKHNEVPAGLILEAPFAKPADLLKYHPLLVFQQYIPRFELVVDAIADDTRLFDSSSRIGYIKSPILILHAEDDFVVPFSLGKTLYQQSVDRRKQEGYLTKFYGFQRRYRYGHKYICRSTLLPNLLEQFIEKPNGIIGTE